MSPNSRNSATRSPSKQLQPWPHNEAILRDRPELGPSAERPFRARKRPPSSGISPQIEHRLFSFVSLNWRGKPLESLEIVLSLIAATTTNTGLKVYARLDPGTYERGHEVTDDQLATVNITRHGFHGDWNYTISPSPIQS